MSEEFKMKRKLFDGGNCHLFTFLGLEGIKVVSFPGHIMLYVISTFFIFFAYSMYTPMIIAPMSLKVVMTITGTAIFLVMIYRRWLVISVNERKIKEYKGLLFPFKKIEHSLNNFNVLHIERKLEGGRRKYYRFSFHLILKGEKELFIAKDKDFAKALFQGELLARYLGVSFVDDTVNDTGFKTHMRELAHDREGMRRKIQELIDKKPANKHCMIYFTDEGLTIIEKFKDSSPFMRYLLFFNMLFLGYGAMWFSLDDVLFDIIWINLSLYIVTVILLITISLIFMTCLYTVKVSIENEGILYEVKYLFYKRKLFIPLNNVISIECSTNNNGTRLSSFGFSDDITKGIIIKSMNGVFVFGGNLPDEELEYIHKLMKLYCQ